MENKRILCFMNDLSADLFKSFIEKIAMNNEMQIIKRPSGYLTDLKSLHYNPYFILRRIVYAWKYKKMQREMISQLNGQYDYFLAIGYYQMSKSFIKELKRKSPQCKTILYLYDTLSKNDFSNDIKLFDSVFTFDRNDAIKYKLEYLPFFIDEYPCETLEYDICHIGQLNAGHIARFNILDSIQKENPSLRTFFYLQYQKTKGFSRQWVRLFIKKIFNKGERQFAQMIKNVTNSDMLHEKRISYDEIKTIEAKSRVILDINEQRAGLSPRIINALGNGKKVITNQYSIKEEVFYDPDFVTVIDENNPQIGASLLPPPIRY